jgi:hypothetical protein
MLHCFNATVFFEAFNASSALLKKKSLLLAITFYKKNHWLTLHWRYIFKQLCPALPRSQHLG